MMDSEYCDSFQSPPVDKIIKSLQEAERTRIINDAYELQNRYAPHKVVWLKQRVTDILAGASDMIHGVGEPFIVDHLGEDERRRFYLALERLFKLTNLEMTVEPDTTIDGLVSLIADSLIGDDTRG